MQLNVDEKTMQALVAKAMFDGMTQDQRDGLVQKAITGILSEPANQHDKTPAIQRLFREQVEVAARNIARERLATDETFKANVEKLFAEAAAKVFNNVDNREAITSALADAMQKAITGDRY